MVRKILRTFGIAVSLSVLKRILRKNVPATCLAYMVDDWRAGRRLAVGNIETLSGTQHTTMPAEESAAFLETVYAAYRCHSGKDRFSGVVAEIGPGDTLGMALLLRANGAEAVHAIDRYRSHREPVAMAAVHRILAGRHGLALAPDAAGSDAPYDGVHYHVGKAAEEFFAHQPGTYDAILSHAVMEHAYDPVRALDGMWSALKPGGVMVHIIDFRDHGMFASHHPLTFLTIPDSLYPRMTRNSGRPNRTLFGDYAHWLRAKASGGKILASLLAGEEGTPYDVAPYQFMPIEQIPRERLDRALATVRALRPRFAPSVAKHDDKDLAIAFAVLVAIKP
jgi:SAM-dependent methyltransferase